MPGEPCESECGEQEGLNHPQASAKDGIRTGGLDQREYRTCSCDGMRDAGGAPCPGMSSGPVGTSGDGCAQRHEQKHGEQQYRAQVPGAGESLEPSAEEEDDPG